MTPACLSPAIWVALLFRHPWSSSSARRSTAGEQPLLRPGQQEQHVGHEQLVEQHVEQRLGRREVEGEGGEESSWGEGEEQESQEN